MRNATHRLLRAARDAPGWYVALGYGLVSTALLVAVDPDRAGVAGWVVALALFVTFAACLIGRADEEGWTIFSVVFVAGLIARALPVGHLVEGLTFTVVSVVVTWLLVDRGAAQPSATSTRS